eukprot:TRINITY_DN7526_c0_g3_i1.p1 TRINITY_DN7526_c0_g3~~TRINITY_DN7526_c0_g3_i1.p1  ORF type:complete len:325 (+),score=47.24 TRINITY_DN7526_c0_g3_i1:50-1024(+)
MPWLRAALLLSLCMGMAKGGAPRNPTMSMFPQEFSVHTGTTIPMNNGLDSQTQAGAVHYSEKKQWLRMDHASQGRVFSFIARFNEGRLYLLNDGSCANVSVNGTLMPFATPKGSVLNEERVLVRDTVVVNYNGVMRAMDGKYHSLDFYVKQINRTAGADAPGNWLPWRTTFSRLFRREIGPSDHQQKPEEDTDDRDWRFYDEGKGDAPDQEIASYDKPANDLSSFDPGQKVTTDYFNYLAREPAAELFEPPGSCTSASGTDVKFSFGSHGGGFGHQIFEFQKALSDLSTDFPHITHNLLEDACLRYFCDASEKDSNHDGRPIGV